MKKLVILMVMIISTASFANPWFDWTVSASGDVALGTTVDVQIIAGSTVPANTFVDATLNVSGGSFVASQVFGGDGWLTVSLVQSVKGDGFDLVLNGQAAGTTPPVAAGEVIYEFSFTADVMGLVVVDAASGQWANTAGVAAPGSEEVGGFLPYAEFNVIPEPMTVLLLGMGGLFLRRRK